MTNGAQGGQGDGQGGQAAKVKVGEKEYSAEDVQGLLSQMKTATERNQQFKAVEDFCNKYNLDVEGLLDNAEGAFGVVSKLIDEKVIDEKGNLIEKPSEGNRGEKGSGSKGSEGDLDLEAILKGDSGEFKGKDRVSAIVLKALEPVTKQMQDFSSAVGEVKELQMGLLRERMQEKIQGKFPDLDEDDISRVLRLAAEDPRRGVMQVAEGVAKRKSDWLLGLKKKHAEEFGVNWEEFEKKEKERNDLGDKGPEGGSIPALEGKKFSFHGKRRGENFVTPLEASQEYLKKNLGEK